MSKIIEELTDIITDPYENIMEELQAEADVQNAKAEAEAVDMQGLFDPKNLEKLDEIKMFDKEKTIESMEVLKDIKLPEAAKPIETKESTKTTEPTETTERPWSLGPRPFDNELYDEPDEFDTADAPKLTAQDIINQRMARYNDAPTSTLNPMIFASAPESMLAAATQGMVMIMTDAMHHKK